ncbi:MAG: EcsC family protein [Defluviitaleaceae bacterium]|nr:EcsC family protein [Defluviitaleaceae bacterium]
MDTKALTTETNMFEETLRAVIRWPGIRIDREQFLRKQLSKYCEDELVDKAIEASPAKAGISPKIVDRIATSSINRETTQVTALSAAAGTAGFIAMIGTVPADLAQFCAHILRITQKLAYLYGWKDIFQDGEDLDDETANQLIIFIGVMFGVSVANGALKKIAILAVQNSSRQAMQRALAQTAIFTVVRQVLAYIGVNLSAKTFAKVVAKTIPIIGAFASGGMTLIMFKPMSHRLKKYLSKLPPAIANYEIMEEELDAFDFSDLVDGGGAGTIGDLLDGDDDGVISLDLSNEDYDFASDSSGRDDDIALVMSNGDEAAAAGADRIFNTNAANVIDASELPADVIDVEKE